MSSRLPSAVGAASARWLYSAHFLADRLPEWGEFRDLDAARIHADLLALWNAERAALLAGAMRDRLKSDSSGPSSASSDTAPRPRRRDPRRVRRLSGLARRDLRYDTRGFAQPSRTQALRGTRGWTSRGRARARTRAPLAHDPRERTFRDLVDREHRASVDRVVPLLNNLAAAEAEADAFVYELYGLTTTMRELVDREYE